MNEHRTLPPKLIARLSSRPSVVLIDGRSGSGKTQLALALARALHASVLHMDELYRGWDGLGEAPALLAAAIRTGRYQPYNWHTHTLEGPATLPVSRPLIIEGCGAISVDTLAELEVRTPSEQILTVWLECAPGERKARALARDGDMFRPHWENWAAQEARLYEHTQAPQLAQLQLRTDEADLVP